MVAQGTLATPAAASAATTPSAAAATSAVLIASVVSVALIAVSVSAVIATATSTGPRSSAGPAALRNQRVQSPPPAECSST